MTTLTNPFSGFPIHQNLAGKRPVAVMIDGHPKAIPQSGLAQADMVFSAEVEDSVLRYLGIFYGLLPDQVGPIRSVRPYFIEWALAYQPFLIHCGGSPQAIQQLARDLPLFDVDYIYLINRKGSVKPLTGLRCFERRKDKQPPHNLYVDLPRFREEMTLKHAARMKQSFPDSLQKEFGQFSAFEEIPHRDGRLPEGKPALSVEVLRGWKQKVRYDYRESDNKYVRWVGTFRHWGKLEPHMDQNTGGQIAVDNLVLLMARSRRITGDLKKRLEIGVMDEGEAVYFVDGKTISGRWLKINADMAIRFFDSSGRRFHFNRGNIWIEVISKTACVCVKPSRKSGRRK